MNIPLQSCSQNAYMLLGCNFDSTLEQISREYRLLMLKYHPDKNPHIDQDTIFTLNQAYEILKDTDSRRLYDSWLKSGLLISFSEWKTLPSNNRLMHWANISQKKALETQFIFQAEHSDNLLQQFREYRI
ncbi:DnaJ sub C member 12 [Entomophthora muscae]|uniref:DnaJ sub C member 12 n=1 Tax=Entomophthora muscae TaxID=34485 RepID=A0ACC2RE91_9FUNG|nr:DnaJ sub C member 12 [Entomophthora muscae]